MLRTIYDSEGAIPDNLKGAYIEKDGQWVLDDLSTDHPIVKKRDSLLTIVASKAHDVNELENWLDVHGKRELPSGHKAVKADVAELGEIAVKAGLTKDEIPKLKTENERLAKEASERDYESTLGTAAKSIGITNEIAFKKLPASKALKLQEVTENGDTKYVVITEKDGKEVRDDFSLEWLEKNDEFAPFMSALTVAADDEDGDPKLAKSKGATKFVKQNKTPADKSKPGDEFDRIREDVKKKVEAQAPRKGTLSERFHNRV